MTPASPPYAGPQPTPHRATDLAVNPTLQLSRRHFYAAIVGYGIVALLTALVGGGMIADIRSQQASDIITVIHHSEQMSYRLGDVIKILRASSSDETQRKELPLMLVLLRTRAQHLQKIVLDKAVFGDFWVTLSTHIAAIEKHLATIQSHFTVAAPALQWAEPLVSALEDERDYFAGDAQAQFQMAVDQRDSQKSLYAMAVVGLILTLESAVFLSVWLLLALVGKNHLLGELTRRDPLTGLLNRRGGMEQGQQALTLSHRLGLHASLAILDLDHFKAINDRHGHPAGDGVLCHTSHLLQQHCRDSDIIARIGGEEFMVVMLTKHNSDGMAVLEALRERIVSSPAMIKGGHGGVRDENALLVIPFTASIGVVTILTGESCDIEDLYHRADRALYRAKAEGRNRVVAS